MVQQLITLPLGGQERTLLYGVNGYYEYIKEATEMDPFDWLAKFDKDVAESQADSGRNILVLTGGTAVLVYAGLNSFLDSKGLANEKFDAVKKWCNGLTIENTVAIFQCAFGTVTQPDKPGELQPNQENGQGKVNA